MWFIHILQRHNGYFGAPVLVFTKMTFSHLSALDILRYYSSIYTYKWNREVFIEIKYVF
jgi:hypothetical protein